MMSSMMGNKMGKMSDEEKEGMMGFMGGETGMNFSGFNPMELMQKMMAAMTQTSEIATFATPEVRQLFEDWVQQVDEEILNHIKDGGSTDPEQIAAYLKISKNSAIYFLTRLAQKGSISIKIEKNDK